MADPCFSAWRLSLVWHETVLDTVALTSSRQAVVFSTGDRVEVSVDNDDGVLCVVGDRLDARLRPGQRVLLPAGHVLAVDVDARAPVVSTPIAVDSTLLHSGMIAVAMTICAVSALWLHPTAGADDPGGGLSSSARRWLAFSGGSAPVVARPTWAASGRQLDLSERFILKKKEGTAAAAKPKRSPVGVNVALDAARDALGENGDNENADHIGEAVRQVAAAPVLAAGVGGLSPKDPVDGGVGNGVIGAGDASRAAALRRQTERDEARALPQRTLYPVSVVNVPDAQVNDGGRLNATPELDPMVREHLTRMIRTRHNVVRGCYEAWGLAADAKQRGRLILELTLRPDGRVQDVGAVTDNERLARVGRCIERAASEWYLGDGLVDEPTRLAFPFNLQPRL